MKVNIRKAELNDCTLLSELGAKTFYDTFHPFHSEEDMKGYISKAYSTDQITLNFLNKSTRYSIAYTDELAIGYTKLVRGVVHNSLPMQKIIELEKIYVLQSFIEMKAGKELMLDAIKFARSEDFDTMILGVWQENIRAINFYKKFGFQEFAFRTFQLGKTICDDYLMKLAL